MAATPEGKVKKQVKTILEDLNIWYFMPAANGYGRTGIPDFVCCMMGGFLAIECKAEGNKLTALQERELDKIAQAGGMPLVVTDQDVHLLNTLLTGLMNNLIVPDKMVH